MPTTNEAEAGKMPAPQGDAGRMPAPQGAKLSVREVFARLEDGALLSPEQKELALQLLAPGRHQLRQAIAVLTVIGAWLAAIAFTIFVFMLLNPTGGNGVIIGLGYCVGATMLRRIARHDFFVQAALAILLAGYGIALISMHESFSYLASHERDLSTSVVAVLLAAVLYVVYDYPVQRFVVPVAAFFVVFTTILARWEPYWLNAFHPLVLVECLGLLLIFAGPARWPSLQPLGHALAVALAVTVAPLTLPGHNSFLVERHGLFVSGYWPSMWPSSQAILAAALGWLACWIARQAQPGASAGAVIKRAPVLVALGMVVLLGLVSSPGILAGLLLAALGHATRERRLEFLGLLVLVGAVSLFGCDFELVLSARAGLLVASGLLLLGARFILWRLTASDARKGAP